MINLLLTEFKQQALAWVLENIGVFGGDNNTITFLGASAGGISVCGNFPLFYEFFSLSCEPPAISTPQAN